jgi:branched-chain amino acid transport system permease protein
MPVAPSTPTRPLRQARGPTSPQGEGEAGAVHRWLAAKSRWSPFEILFWLAALLPFFFLPGYLTLASQIAIAALFAISVDLVLGYAGIVTLGHAMFFGLGAYASGLLSKAGWGEPLSGLVFAAAIAGLAGFVVSFMIVRVKHLALLMITLGLGLLTYELANAMAWLTGGTDGLQGVDIWPLFGTFNFDLWGYTAYAYALAALFFGFVASRRIVNSAFGLALRGVRENVRRMPAIGSDYRWHLQKIYTISAALAGVAGALLTQTTETVSLDTLSFQRSADVVVMLILGGTGRLYGGILGAIIFMVARDQLSGINPQYWYFWIGILLMVVVLTMPSGILGGFQRLLGSRAGQ